MNYTVEWSDAALAALAAVWMAALDRNAVNFAVDVIEAALAVNPHATGAIVFDTVREYEYTPVGVEFEVIDADRRVFVLTMWDTATGRPNPAGN